MDRKVREWRLRNSRSSYAHDGSFVDVVSRIKYFF
jgi:hypothetical protein